LDFSALRGVNLQGGVQIASLQVNHLKFAQFQASLKAANGRLLVAPLQANLYGGTMNGSLAVNAQDNSIALKQSLAGVRVHPLLMDLANKDLLVGTGSVMLDVTGRGVSVDALKKSLAGSASVDLRDGSVKGINLAQSLRDVKSGLALARGAAPDVIQASRKEEKTDFSALTASFRLNNGIAHNNDLSVLSPFLRITGEGDIDIGLNRINYLAKARVVNTSSGQDGRAVDQVAGVTVPVRVTGPLDKIIWKIEFAQAVGGLLKEKTQARVEEKKQEIKQKLNDQLQEKLKGLLGR
jgi:AsmA protein